MISDSGLGAVLGEPRALGNQRQLPDGQVSSVQFCRSVMSDSL